MRRILCIEDDAVAAAEIETELQRSGYVVEVATNGSSGFERARCGSFDVITLDRLLPGLDGLRLVSALREEGIDTPVLMISALSDVDDRITGLRAGGDDYLTKPFASEEMAARVEAMLRRRGASGGRDVVLRAGDVEIDLITRLARRRGVEARLHQTEFRLLELFVRHTGQVLGRPFIFEQVWGYRFDPGTNLVDVHLGRLRRKLDVSELPPIIETIRGMGFVLRNE